MIVQALAFLALAAQSMAVPLVRKSAYLDHVQEGLSGEGATALTDGILGEQSDGEVEEAVSTSRLSNLSSRATYSARVAKATADQELRERQGYMTTDNMLLVGLIIAAAFFVRGRARIERDPRQHLAEAGPQQVWVVVYDLGKVAMPMNAAARTVNTGVYHAGVAVHNIEWSFGPGEPGIFICTPCSNPLHTFRERISVGEIQLTEAQVKEKIEGMRASWGEASYDILRHNCQHFSRALCKELGAPGTFPKWVINAAEAAEVLDPLLPDELAVDAMRSVTRVLSRK